MTVSFHPEAQSEFLAAIDYYEYRERGLGLDFAMEVQTTIVRAEQNPLAWPVLGKGMRRTQTRRFPYGIVYAVDDTTLFILAVMHLHRHPDYWKNRQDD